MSRIDEALKRAGGAAVIAPASSQQEQFVSAWGSSRPVTAPAAGPNALSEPTLDKSAQDKRGAALAALSAAWGERVIIAPQRHHVLVEQFRRLAAVLHKAQSAHGIKVVMVTSAAPSDGKTLTAVNLALVISGSYKRRVLLIDADLRRPSIAEAVGLKRSVGLSGALKARSEQKLELIELTPTLTLLPAGEPDPDPIGSLTSPRMRQILEEAEAQYDWVILDAPPVGLLADAGLMAELVQGTLFVVRAESSQYPLVQSAIEALGRDRLLGIVLNAVVDDGADGAYGYYRYGPRERPS